MRAGQPGKPGPSSTQVGHTGFNLRCTLCSQAQEYQIKRALNADTHPFASGMKVQPKGDGSHTGVEVMP